MRLTIVIPAYNEEAAIAAIIERTLAARAHIVADSPVTEVEVVVVSDGSTDRTATIAREYADITLIEFEHNRGYGAAIKRGFDVGSGDLVGFLDADGTCDPRFFADLCAGLCQADAAIALGSRMGPDSRMPPVRRLGNRIYAGLLSVLTNRVVHDTASGMRVIRRDALPRIYPLPDGLNFTPAMSARALLDPRLPILEIPMSYEERVGESKLNVFRDGLRFFQTILEMTLFWRPARVFLSGALLCGLVTVLLAAHPIEMWVTERQLEESMIYRLLFCSFLGSMAVLLACGLYVSESLHAFNRDARPTDTLAHRALEEVFSARGLIYLTVGLGALIIALIGPGVWTRITQGHVLVHWSRVVLAGLLGFTLAQFYVTRIVVTIIRLHVARVRFRESWAESEVPIPSRTASKGAESSPTRVGDPQPGEVVLT
jgi:glycosyltransferase involved in cell wall biosynthesis